MLYITMNIQYRKSYEVLADEMKTANTLPVFSNLNDSTSL